MYVPLTTYLMNCPSGILIKGFRLVDYPEQTGFFWLLFGSVSTQVTMYYHWLFGIGTCTVGRIINFYWVLQWGIVHFVISWPSQRYWRDLRENFSEMPAVVGCIGMYVYWWNISWDCDAYDGKSGWLYSGHRKYHSFHTQVLHINTS